MSAPSAANGSAGTPVVIDQVNYYFGEGGLQKQILFEVSTQVEAGEIVILTGPSGSGKTTLLTLIGALRSPQDGSVRILGEELNGASAAKTADVRKNIGYIFQAHNLLMSLSARQNVMMALNLQRSMSGSEMNDRAVEILEAVGLAERLDHYPNQLSGGQRQRVAIARALASRPRIILADEPTASLDKQSGRDVVNLMHTLAKKEGVTVLLVTHDNRILDVADRIVNLEDGRICSFTSVVANNTQRMMDLLATQWRKGELRRHVSGLPDDEFRGVLEKATTECQEFLQVVEMSQSGAFESMLDQALEVFTLKIGELLQAERVSLFLVDEAASELYTKVAKGGSSDEPLEIRVPIGNGVVGRVYATGELMNVPDAYDEPLFNRSVDEGTGFRTRAMLTIPIKSMDGRVFAVAQILNRSDGAPFDEEDEQRFAELSTSLAVVLESWWRMGSQERHEVQPS